MDHKIPLSKLGESVSKDGEKEDNKQIVRVIVNQSTCERTGVCEQVCPEDVFLFQEGRTRVLRASNCTYCWICVENCVSGAITLD